MKKIVIASDSFKGSLSSAEVADAIAEGIRCVYPSCEIICLRMGDGGEGTCEAMAQTRPCRWINIEVNDPLGRPCSAKYALYEDEDGKSAIIEMAQASGLTLLSPEERNPLRTSTFGTGQMIMDAFNRGCRRFTIGLGGSATNDGGTGMLEALGFKFLDKKGKEIKGCCGGRLGEIADIDSKSVSQEILDSEFIVACDVNTPFCGKEGATRIFARQKGADEEALESLESGMQSFAHVINHKYGIKLNEIPGTGAAGGLGGAFKAFLNAELKSGIDMILDAAGFDEIIKDATLVITGEGKIDFQSSRGKVIDGICRRCRARNVPVLAIAGIVDNCCHTDDKDEYLTVLPIGPRPQNESDLEYAMRPEVARRNITDTIIKILPEFL